MGQLLVPGTMVYVADLWLQDSGCKQVGTPTSGSISGDRGRVALNPLELVSKKTKNICVIVRLWKVRKTITRQLTIRRITKKTEVGNVTQCRTRHGTTATNIASQATICNRYETN